MWNFFEESRKAIVPLAVGGGLVVLGTVGITGEMTVKEALTLVATSILVWFTRNKAK